ncbi:hypothetical protein AKJ47_02680 [candidate division MSBL1 archaeon SCGC-AAA261G05]|uniref:Uncharacterized protein n=1 Tax=candidate division MSBL1 archaeon SCGC-AAA261G05 TaxID=1698276 RepID=A0A133VA01_9EURY|nr:hypothetical protein AKJ47_02680 [candidate division MSBL1 archaeon SCGC-AAA261G05]
MKMKWKPRCIVCEMEGAFEQAKLSTEDEALRSKALREVSGYLSEAPRIFRPRSWARKETELSRRLPPSLIPIRISRKE